MYDEYCWELNEPWLFAWDWVQKYMFPFSQLLPLNTVSPWELTFNVLLCISEEPQVYYFPPWNPSFCWILPQNNKHLPLNKIKLQLLKKSLATGVMKSIDFLRSLLCASWKTQSSIYASYFLNASKFIAFSLFALFSTSTLRISLREKMVYCTH